MDRAIYRIIDANFNRAREALRVIEEFCRFALDSELLTRRAKQLRHTLTTAINKLDAGRLVASRDTLGDVGVGTTVDNQQRRKNLEDCFSAGCKRLTEALRALEETVRTLNPSVSAQIERLRYDAYTLEKDTALFCDTAKKFRPVRLYVIISSNLPAEVIPLTLRCTNAGADCIQLRAKCIQDDRLLAVAREFVDICGDAGVISVINDRVDIAVSAGADGVHLGRNDLPTECARKLASSPLIIGRTTHSLEQLKATCEQLPTYVSLGPVFPTPTKPDAQAVGLDYISNAIEALKDTGIGHVAIGGINEQNIDQVLRAGARTVAVCSVVSEAADPAAVCHRLKGRISGFAH